MDVLQDVQVGANNFAAKFEVSCVNEEVFI